jgi:hypothetical protein
MHSNPRARQGSSIGRALLLASNSLSRFNEKTNVPLFADFESSDCLFVLNLLSRINTRLVLLSTGGNPIAKHIRHSVLPLYKMHQLGRSKLQSELAFLISHGHVQPHFVFSAAKYVSPNWTLSRTQTSENMAGAFILLSLTARTDIVSISSFECPRLHQNQQLWSPFPLRLV